jgi:hypothetical protein
MILPDDVLPTFVSHVFALRGSPDSFLFTLTLFLTFHLLNFGLVRPASVFLRMRERESIYF